MKNVALILMSFVLTACSNQSLYGELQRSQKHQCLTEAANNAAYDACLNKVETSFEEYERMRQELINIEKNERGN